MSVAKIYISCPMIEPIGQLEQVATVCKKILTVAEVDAFINWWNRKEYVKSYLDDANIFVLMLPGNAWEYPIEGLPVGCKKELDIARKANKKIFIAYRNKTGEYNIYNSTTWNTKSSMMIGGVAGTTNLLYNYLKLLQSKNEKPMETKYIREPSISYMNMRELQDTLKHLYGNLDKKLIVNLEKIAMIEEFPDRRLLFKLKKR